MSITQNLTAIRATLAPHVTLVAVSKTVEEARIREALAAGQRVFGENYVQEAKAKWPALKAEYPDTQLHLIGHLQSNKAEDAVRLFDRIDTLDRISLAGALAKAMRKHNRNVPCLIEVNIGEEPQKAGCAIAEIPTLLEHAKKLEIVVSGLICIPPVDGAAIRSVPVSAETGTTARAEEGPELYFKKLAALAAQYHLPVISMGMSGDYQTAIACGSTEVRVGTAIFGKRD